MNTSFPIAISLGDPAGIGPEIVVKALADPALAAPCLVVGDRGILEREARQLSLPVPAAIDEVTALGADFPRGRIDARGGEAAYRYVLRGARLALEGKVRALVTAPLSKEALHAAGHDYPGHTELLAELAGNASVRMMLANSQLRVVLVTIHLSLRAALDALAVEPIVQTIVLADRALRGAGIAAPRIAVAGVNPHAGEGGLFGREEIDIVAPAIAAARARGIDASGPHAPDTVFMRARAMREFDVVVAMYHDQGLIPVKYMGIDDGVNITIGLPFVRTSPDHGTAFDIAGKGVADARSLLAAIARADELSRAGEPSRTGEPSDAGRPSRATGS